MVFPLMGAQHRRYGAYPDRSRLPSMQHRHGILARPGRFIPGRAAWASRRSIPG